jgi:mannose-6-phosphate isomerase-like protein (cupin superfamily)
MGQVLQTTDWNAANRVRQARLGELGFTAFCLAPGESTAGHSHTLVEELTIFQAGEGQIEIEDQCHPVCAGSVSVVPAGQFHCITNTGTENLEGVIVFNRNVNRKKVKLKNRKEHFGKKKAKKLKAKHLQAGKAAGAPASAASEDALAAIGTALVDLGEELKTLRS